MIQNILRAQFFVLFLVTITNLVYFWFKDSLPDNVFEISSMNNSINFLSYYISSVVSVISYFTGTWVLGSFVLFTIFYTSIYSKRDDSNDLYYLFLFITATCGVAYLFMPKTIGEGVNYIITNFIGNTLVWIISFISIAAIILTNFEGLYSKIVDGMKRLSQAMINLYRKKSYLKIANREKKAIAASTSPTASTLAAKAVAEDVNVKDRVKEIFKKETARVREIVSLDKLKEALPLKEKREDFDEKEVSTVDVEVKKETTSTDVQKVENKEADDRPIPKDISIFKNKRKEPNFFESDDLIDCITNNSMSMKNKNPDKEYFEQIIEALEDKFKDFKISANVIDILKGPVVDTFEVELGPGVKVSKIQGIQKDLTLALRGAPVRIVTNMKGRATIGIEVPRAPREFIFLDEVLRSDTFNSSKMRLPIAMGKNAFGEPTVVDLASMPHMLVAGSTGAGKSVFINTLLVSLLIKLPPEKMRLILVDPKQLELALYQELPHLILPVVTEPTKAGIALLWAVQEMERRYSILREFGVRNIEGFNKKITKATDEEIMKIHRYYEGFEGDGYELPYIVIVVDEFADLILTKEGKQIENSICRLAAKARASGIHLVLATQRPSVDVITGLIKANFPTRVSFRVTSSTDSRTILNTTGAETLLGKGDMLYRHGVDMQRLHSAFVDEDEIEQLMEKLADIPREFNANAMEFFENGGPEDEFGNVNVSFGASNSSGNLAADDPKYHEAYAFAMENRKVSASLLQRKLGIGYNRAARIIELMEERGIVGPQQGSKPRKVLMGSDS